MSGDLAVWAAKRVLPGSSFNPGFDSYSDTALEAAREALKPIRDLADRWHAATNLSNGQPNIVARAFAEELYRALGDEIEDGETYCSAGHRQ